MASPHKKDDATADTSHHFTIFGLSRLVVAILSSLAWMAVSSALILLNKELLSHGFRYPMALSGLGMLFSSVASYLCCRVFRLVEAKRVVSTRFYVTRILPVGLFMALTLLFGNLVYLYLTVAFIQMLKAFTPIITMVSLFAAGLEAPTRQLIFSVSFIAVGTAMASLGEVNFDLLGVIIMFASEVCESIRLVMTQVLLTGLKFHPIKYTVAAAMGFGVNALAYICIQTASSLTLKVLGTVKNALVVVLGMAFLRERVTPLQGAGYAVSIAAFFVYQQLKMAQISASAQIKSIPSASVIVAVASNGSGNAGGGGDAGLGGTPGRAAKGGGARYMAIQQQELPGEKETV
eukprot:scaffold4.g4993.t1